MRRALITGITGQDGSYLADLLLEIPRLGSSFEFLCRQRHPEGPELLGIETRPDREEVKKADDQQQRTKPEEP